MADPIQCSPACRNLPVFQAQEQYPNKAKKALVSALTGIPIAVLAGYIVNTYILS